ncbi:unnamed protein product, partial [Didymodactylos carnosus]
FSEHYFAINGAALVLPKNECLVTKAVTGSAAHLQQHLQQMFSILRPEDRIILAVKLESGFPNRIRYLVIVSCIGRQDSEESAILGFDFSSNEVTIGMILPIFADMNITLDGDGSAYQSLHKASTQARLFNYMAGGLTHTWIEFYRSLDLQSNQMCINEWFQMDEILSHRSDSPHLYQTLSSDEEILRQHIHVKLKEIMLMVDLDEVTSKFLREQLENVFQMNLSSHKQYIDDVMLQILAQMDKPTMILSHLYLGSEWNASNYEELKANNVGYILNVSREIDNFFPGQFKYLNVRVHDNDEADLLKEWEKTYRFINEAKANNQACLVHCKMGISRSASTVLAYLMKENSHTLNDALDHVKKRRSCINPNGGFRSQLQVYEGILAANKTFRSKLGDVIIKKPLSTVPNNEINAINTSGTLITTSIIREPSPTNTVTLLSQEKI